MKFSAWDAKPFHEDEHRGRIDVETRYGRRKTIWEDRSRDDINADGSKDEAQYDADINAGFDVFLESLQSEYDPDVRDQALRNFSIITVFAELAEAEKIFEKIVDRVLGQDGGSGMPLLVQTDMRSAFWKIADKTNYLDSFQDGPAMAYCCFANTKVCYVSRIST